jgi:large subunit ribosomal protein L24
MENKVKHKIKKGDIVMVIAGNYMGKSGRVLSILPDEDRLYVEGINIIKKHTKPNAKKPERWYYKKRIYNSYF